MLEDCKQDLHFTFRLWRRAPAFYALLALTLALGIGATTAVYSFAVALVLRPLPFSQPRRIIEIQQYLRSAPHSFSSLAGPDYLTYHRENHVFTSMALYLPVYFNLTGGGTPIRVLAARIEPKFFHILGQPLARGHNFTRAEATANAPVVILGYRLWRERFGGDPGILGKKIELNGADYKVVGITPKDRRFTGWAQLYTPLNLASPVVHYPGEHRFLAIARLRAGITLAAARHALDLIARQREQRHPKSDHYISARLVRLPDAIYGNQQRVIALLLAAVGLLMLLACANTAGLLLARSRARRHEIVLRSALGATRGRLLRQLLTESLALALLAGMLGLLWAPLALHLLAASGWLPSRALDYLRIDWGVLGFALLISGVCGLLFGLAPALDSFRSDLRSLLQSSGGRGLAQGNWRAHRILIAAELAIVLVLLGQAGLLAGSLHELDRVPLGFAPRGVLKLSISYPRVDPGNLSRLRLLNQRLVKSLARLPGARSAAAVIELPPHGYFTGTVTIRGLPEQTYDGGPFVHYSLITPGYFRTLRIARLQGRNLRWSDDASARPVIVISRTMARFFWPHRNPLGRELNFYAYPGIWWTVVGVVGDAVNAGLKQPPQPEIYFPEQQAALPNPSLYLLVRSTGRASELIEPARRLIHRLAPELPVMHPEPLRKYLSRGLLRARMRTALLLIFAALAVLLASLGIYGLVSHAAGERRRELAIRSALGAQPESIRRLLLVDVLRLTAIGTAAGLLLELWLARFSRSLLFHLSSSNPYSLSAGVLVLIATVLIAALPPARRAARTPAAETLREE